MVHSRGWWLRPAPSSDWTPHVRSAHSKVSLCAVLLMQDVGQARASCALCCYSSRQMLTNHGSTSIDGLRQLLQHHTQHQHAQVRTTLHRGSYQTNRSCSTGKGQNGESNGRAVVPNEVNEQSVSVTWLAMSNSSRSNSSAASSDLLVRSKSTRGSHVLCVSPALAVTAVNCCCDIAA